MKILIQVFVVTGLPSEWGDTQPGSHPSAISLPSYPCGHGTSKLKLIKVCEIFKGLGLPLFCKTHLYGVPIPVDHETLYLHAM